MPPLTLHLHGSVGQLHLHGATITVHLPATPADGLTARQEGRVLGRLTEEANRLRPLAQSDDLVPSPQSLVSSDLKESAMPRTQAEFDAQQQLIDQYTTQIADRITALVAQLKAGGLSESAEEAIFTKLVAQADALRPLGTVDNPPAPPA
jgi:hypothetical protein